MCCVRKLGAQSYSLAFDKGNNKKNKMSGGTGGGDICQVMTNDAQAKYFPRVRRSVGAVRSLFHRDLHANAFLYYFFYYMPSASDRIATYTESINTRLAQRSG